MLVNMSNLMELAKVNNKAVGAFNITGLEMLQATIDAAEKLNEPVILQFAQVHEEENVIDLDTIGPIMVLMAEKSSVPIAVHLDHGVDIQFIKKALDMGFTSVMYDGSSLSFEENVAYTKMVVRLAKTYDADVEAEIGVMSGLTLNENKEVENRRSNDRSMYTDPIQAKEFVEKTGVDCLACAFGTVHGMYATTPQLDFELVKELNDTIGVPIVMHGGSGVSKEDYDVVINNGVRKVNYYTYMAKAGGDAIKKYDLNKDVVLFHDLANAARKAMQDDIEEAIKVFKHQ